MSYASRFLVSFLFVLTGFGSALAQSGPLRPGDMVRVTLSRMPDMSGDYTVDESGDVGLPMVGVIRTTDRPADELKRSIVAQYEEQVRNQSIQVMFLRRVSVLGAVENPGLYHLEPTMTLADAVALAGGHTREGRPDRVKVVTDGREIEVDITSSTMRTVASGSRIIVPERSWAVRNSRMLIGAGISAAVVLSRILID